ncbi:MAG: ABC transporter permease [Bacteroidetes bacterium]|nr:ABC transporter permease [Bacteroidota bacterium]
MLKNYFTTAVRNLWRSKGSTLINVSGLTLGVTTSLILFLLVRYQLSFDNFHPKGDRIYRVVSSSEGNQGKDFQAGVPPVLPEAFRNDFPEAEEVIFTSYRGNGALITIPQKSGELKKFEEGRGVVYAPPGYFNLFDRKVLMGDAKKGLDEPNEAVISKASALKYFGKDDAIGEVFNFESREFKVTAIVEDLPTNTDFPFDVILSYATIKKEKDEVGWNGIWSDEHCYFLLKREAKIQELERRLQDFAKKYHGENPDKVAYELQPLSEIHFDDRFGNYNYSTTTRPMLTAMAVIGIFLVITACINFINLVTAESIKRSKEVGIRKTLGSSRGQLVMQFLGESSLVTIVAVMLAVGFAQLGLGFLNSFLSLNLSIDLLSDGSLWIFLLSITAFVGILSGLYPSLIVSRLNPVFAIKNQSNNRSSSSFMLRRGLVVLQFSISQLFIIGTIILINQMDYFKSKDLGFKKDAIITMPIPENEAWGFKDGTSKMKTLREEVSRMKGIEAVSLNSAPPSSGSVQSTDFVVEGSDQRYGTQVKQVDGNYAELFGLQFVAGTNVQDMDTARGFVVNEKLAAMVGYENPQDLIGKNIIMWRKTLPVVGVVKNFHTMSLHEPIEATIMLNRIQRYRSMAIKVNPLNVQETIKAVQQKWEATYPEAVFSYEFLDEEINSFYEQEAKMSTLLTIFTSIAIFIGCLGLFGLAAFMANQKTKEIGVRKVLGASVESILLLFSKEYLVLIVIGFVVATPFAWYFSKLWLQDFEYRITVGPAYFVIGLLITFVIALVTVGYRSLRAATVNPVDSLRSE